MRTVRRLTGVNVSSTGRPAISMGVSSERRGEEPINTPKPAVAKLVRVCLRVPSLSITVALNGVSAFCIGLDSLPVVNREAPPVDDLLFTFRVGSPDGRVVVATSLTQCKWRLPGVVYFYFDKYVNGDPAIFAIA